MTTPTLRDARQLSEAATRPQRLAFKTATTDTGQTLGIEDAEGIVTAIVSVTGTEDEVNDIIVPGAYAETLAKRRPKVCWAHSWEHPIGRVLHIEELMPGDPRLPAETKDGQPWPAEAGALVATMQFNLRSPEGKSAFEVVRFYSETGECEFSIGYQVPAGKANRDRAGTRHIKSLDLYELSVVLFGAHTMTGTLSIKAAAALARKGARQVTAKDILAAIRAESKAKPKKGVNPFAKKKDEDDEEDPKATAAKPGEEPEEDEETDEPTDGTAPKPETPPKPPEQPAPGQVKPADAPKPETPDFSDGVMVAVYPDPGAARNVYSAVSGTEKVTPVEELHVTLAYLGKTNEVGVSNDELVALVQDAVEGFAALEGNVGGIGTFPPAPNSEDGAPTWVPVDVPRLSLLREQIVAALGEDRVKQDHGFTPHMTIGYDLGLIEPVPETPVRFNEVRVVFGTVDRRIPLSGNLDEEDEVKPTPERKAIADALARVDLSGKSVDEVARLTAIAALCVPLDVKAGGADRNRGGAEKLRRYWTVGEGGIKIGWGTPGDFTRCVKFLDEHMPGRAEGYCANRHKEMTGMWPGDKDNKGLWREALHPRDRYGRFINVGGTARIAETDYLGREVLSNTPVTIVEPGLLRSVVHTPDGDVTVSNRKITMLGGEHDEPGEKSAAYDPALEHKGSLTPVPAGKGYPRLPGTFEERMEAIRCAVTDSLRGEEYEDGKREWDYVSIDGTWPDRVVATRESYNDERRESFEVPYSVTEEGVVLGDLTPVELELSVVSSGDYDDDDLLLGDLLPIADSVLTAADAFKHAHRASIEVKAGRVLSGANERRLRESVERLIDVLAAAGVYILADPAERDKRVVGQATRSDVRRDPDPDLDLTSTAPSAQVKALGTVNADGSVTLDADDVQAQIDRLLAGLD